MARHGNLLLGDIVASGLAGRSMLKCVGRILILGTSFATAVDAGVPEGLIETIADLSEQWELVEESWGRLVAINDATRAERAQVVKSLSGTKAERVSAIERQLEESGVNSARVELAKRMEELAERYAAAVAFFEPGRCPMCGIDDLS
jgi:hypothetical protein